MSQFIDYSNPSGSKWTRSENILLERAILKFPEGTSNRWEKIAHQIPGKSPIDVLEQYSKLVQDINAIEAGDMDRCIPSVWISDGDQSKESSDSEIGEKKAASWTKEEHILFLEGLAKYGNGDWESISKHSVTTKTPMQVSTYAHQYFREAESKI